MPRDFSHALTLEGNSHVRVCASYKAAAKIMNRFLLSDNASIVLPPECGVCGAHTMHIGCRAHIGSVVRNGMTNAAKTDVSSGPGHAMRLSVFFAHWR